MAFPRPTLAELVARSSADVSGSILNAGVILQRSVVMVLVRVFSALVHTLYDDIGYSFRNSIPDTATDEFLDQWANIWLPAGRLPAAPAQAQMTITGVDTTAIPAGTQYSRSDGQTYTVDVTVNIAGSSVVASVTAEVPGVDGNGDAGSILSLVTPIVGIDTDATVDSTGIVGGTDTETDDSLRARMLSAIRTPAQGGSLQDYIDWMSAIPDVDQIFVQPQFFGLGTVRIQFTTFSGTEIPSAPKIASVQAEIDTLRPVTAYVSVDAVLPYTLVTDLTILPNTAAMQAVVTAEIVDQIKQAREPSKLITIAEIQNAAIRAGATSAVVNLPIASADPGADGIVNVFTVTYS
jgi:uncharacterized phage protein gp47/JayE